MAIAIVDVRSVDIIGITNALVAELESAGCIALDIEAMVGVGLGGVEGILETDTDATVVDTTGGDPEVATTRGTLELPNLEQISSKALLNAINCYQQSQFRRSGSIYHNHQLMNIDL